MKKAYFMPGFFHEDADVFLADGQYGSGRLHSICFRHPEAVEETLTNDGDRSVGLNCIGRNAILSAMDCVSKSRQSRLASLNFYRVSGCTGQRRAFACHRMQFNN